MAEVSPLSGRVSPSSPRPYPPHYRAAFACSAAPLPPPPSPSLAVGIPPPRSDGTSGAYPVVQWREADGEAASSSPTGHGATVVDVGTRRTDPHALLAPAYQMGWTPQRHRCASMRSSTAAGRKPP